MFEVPASPKLYTEDLVNFLGVDYTSIAPIKNRATEMRNLINNDGYLETRPGFDEISSFGVVATLTLTFDNDTITFTSIRKGEPSNDITVSFVNPGKANKKLKFEEHDKNVIVSLATDKDGNIITTLGDICALNSKYVTMSCTNASKVVTEVTPNHLTDGVSYRINGLWK